MKIYTSANVSQLEFTSVERKPRKMYAVRIEEDFSVVTGDGEGADMRGGDYLVMDDKDRLYGVKAEEFDREFRGYTGE